MLFNTVEFIIFLPIAVAVYYLLPFRFRYIWLLATSYYFYMQWNAVYGLLLLGTTAISYLAGRWIEKYKGLMKEAEAAGDKEALSRAHSKKKLILGIAVGICLFVLGFYKYAEFLTECLNYILGFLHLGAVEYTLDVILPVGISFYTLQSIGYMVDVYRDDVYAEKNFLKYALFISFFPQLVAGPIERSKNLLAQLQTEHKFAWENLKRGILLLLYGLFLKMVIGDRASMILDTVYADPLAYGGAYSVVVILLFPIQIYCDFYGYTTIARGVAEMMGFTLVDNFNAPFLSENISETWRRWHMSLTGWFRDYLYFPLGGSRKGKLRKEINILIIFTVSGLWHGASFAYVTWGLLSGIEQVISDLILSFKKKHGINVKKQHNFSERLWRVVCTYFLFSFSALFFRAGTMATSFAMIKSLFVNNWYVLFDGSLLELGVERQYMAVLLLSILVLYLVDRVKYQGRDVAGLVMKQSWIFQAFTMLLLTFVILVFGVYGELYDLQAFAYFQF